MFVWGCPKQFVILREHAEGGPDAASGKNLPSEYEMLRFAQHDKRLFQTVSLRGIASVKRHNA